MSVVRFCFLTSPPAAFGGALPLQGREKKSEADARFNRVRSSPALRRRNLVCVATATPKDIPTKWA
jgi:hypothetical protein